MPRLMRRTSSSAAGGADVAAHDKESGARFLTVDENEFDGTFARIRDRQLAYWAWVYFCDPNGHLLEIITRPYGSRATTSRLHLLLSGSWSRRRQGSPGLCRARFFGMIRIKHADKYKIGACQRTGDAR